VGSPSESNLSDVTIAEGPAVGWAGRMCCCFCFIFIPPLFLWVWIDDPKFLKAPNPIPGTVIMGVVTLGMFFLALFGLFANFAKTRVTRRQIEWGIFRRHQLPIDDIQNVVNLFSLRINFIYIVTILQLVTVEGRRVEIAGGTQALEDAFYGLKDRFST
jgi:hypothetical protein